MNRIKQILLTMVVALGMTGLGHSQATTTATTLSAAVTSSSVTTITVTSATGFTAGTTSAFVGRELMEVISVSGTTIGVRRGSAGIASTHANAAPIWVGPRGTASPFVNSARAGSCTAANQSHLPKIDVNTGLRYGCQGGSWALAGGPVTVSAIAGQFCGTTSTCAATPATVRVVTGSAALVSASPSAVTITGISPAFTSTSTFMCTASPVGTTAAIASTGVAVDLVSGSSITITGPNTVTTVVTYICVGT
jgi:hypothetical protein